MPTQAKTKLVVALLLAAALVVGVRSCLPASEPSSGLTQTVQQAAHKQRKTLKVRQVVKARIRVRETVQTRRYDPNTGRLVSETRKVRSQDAEQQRTHETQVTEQAEATQVASRAVQADAAPTGVVAGGVLLPAGGGVTAGVTLAELPPVSLSAQAGLLVVPQVAPVAGLALNGVVAPRLVAGFGVYLGPQTALGYTPLPGLPVSVQPGFTLQYRF